MLLDLLYRNDWWSPEQPSGQVVAVMARPAIRSEERVRIANSPTRDLVVRGRGRTIKEQAPSRKTVDAAAARVTVVQAMEVPE